MKKSLLLALAAATVALPLRAQITGVEVPQSGLQYERSDFDVTLVGEWTNPFRQSEAKLDMIAICPSGATAIVPGFWCSGESGNPSRWQVRFAPRETGHYSFIFKYSAPGLESVSSVYGMDVAPGDGHGFLHPNDDWTLRYDDGTLFRGIGENICWESRDNDDSKFFSDLHEQHDRFNYPAMLPKFAQNGGNFVRIWMCSWNFPIDRQDDFNNSRYTPATAPVNESAAARLDETLALCEQLGLKVMLCMGQGDVRADRDFFAGAQQQERYMDRLRYIVARWGFSRAVAMWEFFNEIDNIQFADAQNPIPEKDIVDWHAKMARYLKSIDAAGHIVTTSISHRDLQGLNSVADIDINQKHIYRGTSSIPSTIESYRVRFGKPYIIGEFGYEWDWSKNFDDFADGMCSDFRRGLWQGLFNPTPVTPMSWWWEWFDEHDMVRYFRAPALLNAEMLEAGKGAFEKLNVNSPVETYALRCGAKTYIYVFNGTKSRVRTIPLGISGSLRELNIEKAVWGKSSHCNGTLRINLRPGREKVFVLE